jgi:hypothetical protein
MRKRSGYLLGQIGQEFEFQTKLARSSIDTQATLARLADWTAGHPFLSYRLCEFVQTEIPREAADGDWVDRLIEQRLIARCDDRPLRSHLEKIHRFIVASDLRGDLLALYRSILAGQSVRFVSQDRLHRRLLQSGLVRVHQGRLICANRFYQTLFGEAWLDRFVD